MDENNEQIFKASNQNVLTYQIILFVIAIILWNLVVIFLNIRLSIITLTTALIFFVVAFLVTYFIKGYYFEINNNKLKLISHINFFKEEKFCLEIKDITTVRTAHKIKRLFPVNSIEIYTKGNQNAASNIFFVGDIATIKLLRALKEINPWIVVIGPFKITLDERITKVEFKKLMREKNSFVINYYFGFTTAFSIILYLFIFVILLILFTYMTGLNSLRLDASLFFK